MRKTKKYVVTPGLIGKSSLRKMDVLILTHKYDKLCFYLTVPLIFESEERYPEYKNVVLEAVEKKLHHYSQQ